MSKTGLNGKHGRITDNFLALLPEVLEPMRHQHLIMVGDFNQQFGQRGYAPWIRS